MNKLRIGKFKISEILVNDKPDIVKKVMGKCIIVDCKFEYADRCFHYTAICDDFQEIEQGNQILFYQVHIKEGEVNFDFNNYETL